MKNKQKSAKSTTATKKRYEGFTDEEKDAMKSRVKEMKAVANKADWESELAPYYDEAERMLGVPPLDALQPVAPAGMSR